MVKELYNRKHRFEWDEDKNRANIAKHGISFVDAQQAFQDKDRMIEDDASHSDCENRYYCIGYVNERIATVRFAVRRKRIRIIGAGYWRKGKRDYERKNR